MGDWTAVLTVGVSERGRLLSPLLRIEGRSDFGGGAVRVELVDELDLVQRVVRRPLPATSLGKQLRLPCLTLPTGTSADEVMRWSWRIVVEREGSELVRWRRYLAPATSLNAEAEIELAGLKDPRRAKEEAEGRGPEALWNEYDSDRLLAVLVDEGELTEREREAALAIRVVAGKTVERVLIDRGWVDERELLALYSELTGTEFLDLAECSIDPYAASLIPEEMAVDYGLIGIGFRNNELLTVAMSDPQHPRAALEIEAATWLQVYIVVATRDDVFSALETTLLRSLDDRGPAACSGQSDTGA